MVEFQPCSGITTVLDSVTYCCVLQPCLPFYSSPNCSYHTISFANLGVTCLQPSILNSLSASPTTWFPLHSYLLMSTPKTCFLRLRQGFLILPLCCILPPPFFPPAITPFIVLSACAHFKNRPQRYSLCNGCLPSPNVGHRLLSSRRFPHLVRPGYLPCPVCKLPCLCTCYLPKKPCVCPFYLYLHCRQKYPSLISKN